MASPPSSTDRRALAEYYIDHDIPQRFNAGLIITSIIVAFIGAWSALQVLGKRTSSKGTRNLLLLILSAIMQSCVGIWSMHGVGMWTLTLVPAPDVTWHVDFEPGFTALSLLVPLLALCVAFFFLDFGEFRFWRAIVSGCCTGATIGFMHYSASFRTKDFHVSYNAGVLVVSILLAMAAATVALTLFFRFKAKWDDRWWKRMLCAWVLAVAVSAMHYTGVAATHYRVGAGTIDEILAQGPKRSNNVLIAAIVMCTCFWLIAFGISVTDAVSTNTVRQNARKLVVCSATFNTHGQLLVKEDGTLPMVVIETPLYQGEITAALDKRQATFQWLYAVSWDWNIVADFLSAISLRLCALEEAAAAAEGKKSAMSKPIAVLRKLLPQRRKSIGEDRPGWEGGSRYDQTLAEFRERFIDAAGQLAGQLDVPFQRIGVLYDEYMSTGTRRAAQQAAKVADDAGRSEKGLDEEARSPSTRSPSFPPSIFEEGDEEQEGAMLFLVRQIDANSESQRESEERYLQKGFRLTEVRFLAGHLANQYAVPKKDMETWLLNLRMYAKRGIRPVVQSGGVYLGLFGVRPALTLWGGLETLVYDFARHQIPAYRLPQVDFLSPQMRAFVRSLDRATLEEARAICLRETTRASEVQSFAASRRASRVSRAHFGSMHALTDDASSTITDESSAPEQLTIFQTSLCVTIDALEKAMDFYPHLKDIARLSADIVEVPSTLDDSGPPAECIVVQTVLPEGEFLLSHGLDPMLSDEGKKMPFTFTPYSLFVKSQMMLMRGRQADDFELEVVRELKARYPGVRTSALVDLDQQEGEAAGIGEQLARIEPPKRHGAGNRWMSILSRRQSVDVEGQNDAVPSTERQMTSKENQDLVAAVSTSLAKPYWTGVETLNIDDPRKETSGTDEAPSSPIFKTLIKAATGAMEPSNARSAGESFGIRRFLNQQSKKSGADTALNSPDRATAASPLRSETTTSSDARTLEKLASPTSTSFTDAKGTVSTLSPSGRRSSLASSSVLYTPATGADLSQMISGIPLRLRHRIADVEPRPAGRLSQRRLTAPGAGGPAGAPVPAIVSSASMSSSGHDVNMLAAAVAADESGASEAQDTLTHIDARSVRARHRSDAWMTRHLTAIERGPGGRGLLGVDY
ncbi:unnamed protein product [Jaminaea pallidilutea]